MKVSSGKEKNRCGPGKPKIPQRTQKGLVCLENCKQLSDVEVEREAKIMPLL